MAQKTTRQFKIVLRLPKQSVVEIHVSARTPGNAVRKAFTKHMKGVPKTPKTVTMHAELHEFFCSDTLHKQPKKMRTYIVTREYHKSGTPVTFDGRTNAFVSHYTTTVSAQKKPSVKKT